MLPTIRPMTAHDVEPAAAMVVRGGWGDRRVFLGFAADHAACRPVVAETDGEIVATGVGTASGAAGWIGAIFVDADWRRRGLGTSVTQALIDDLDAAGCRTLALVATEAGRRLYERMGFEVATWYRTFEAPGMAGTTNAFEADGARRQLRAFGPADLPALAAIDRSATGEDRSHLLHAFATVESARCLVDLGGQVRGSVVRAPWGGGATIASNLDDGLLICEARRASAATDRRIRAGILRENEAGADGLQRLGWTEAWRAPRMHRGDPLAWDPRAIWGQFNHAIG